MNSEPNQSATIGIISVLAIVAAGAYLIYKGINANALIIVLISGVVAAWFGLGIAVMVRGLVEHRVSDTVCGFVAAAAAIIVPYLLLIADILRIATN